MNILTSVNNKELLWNSLYENSYFEMIPTDKLDIVKEIFERCVLNVAKNIKGEQFDILEANKLILSKIINDIKVYKKDKKLEEVKILEEDLNNYIISKPDNIDFSDKNDDQDEAIEPNSLNNMLEELQALRNNEFLNEKNISNKETLDNSINKITNNLISEMKINKNVKEDKKYILNSGDYLNQEYNYERILNLSKKMDIILNKINVIDEKQDLILEKLK
tara:strand:- start:3965 stop:4624 length:660 start_codon:yes stop_codon:yes gene_type:complete